MYVCMLIQSHVFLHNIYIYPTTLPVTLTPFSLSIYIGQKGLISCIEFNPDRSGVYAAGSYQHSVGIYIENQQDCALQLNSLGFGVTGLKWSACGNNLWVGGRRNGAIVCWDVRHGRNELGR